MQETDPAVSFDGLDKRSKCVGFQHNSVGMQCYEVQVLERGAGFGALGPRCPPLVGATFQVIFLMVANRRRQQVVHYDEPNVLPTALQITANRRAVVIVAAVVYVAHR